MNAIEIQHLRKRYAGDGEVLRGMDLQVPSGVVYGLLGRNGSGKTTSLRILMGLLHASAGSARIFGTDMWSASRQQRARVAYVSQDLRLLADMTLAEHQDYVAALYGSFDQRRAAVLRASFGLSPDVHIAAMSGGQQRLAAILLALCGPAEVLVFDEPTAGLDPLARRKFMEACAERLSDAPETTVLLSTHLLSDLERLATHIGVLEEGQIRRGGELSTLLETTQRIQVIFPEGGPPEGVLIPPELLGSLQGPVLQFVSSPETADFLAALEHHPEVRVQAFPVNLEELFIEWSKTHETGVIA